MISIPYQQAAFCCNCNNIVPRLDECPICTSKSLIILARVLDRKEAA